MSVVTVLSRYSISVMQLQGWRRNLAGFAFGVCATLALPPVDAIVFLFPAFCGLFWLLDSAVSKRRAFADGWWFGLGHFTTGLYWMCIALLTDPVRFGWLIPFTLIGLNGIIAIYIGLVGLALYLTPMRGLARVFAFAVLWSVAEYARGHLFSGFPWNLIGYAWSASDAMYQSLSVLGVYGLGLVTVLFFTLPAALVGAEGRRSGVALCVISLAVLAMACAGQYRLNTTPITYVPGVTLRIVQGNVEQTDKWDPRHRMQTLKKYVELTRSPGFEDVSAVIWPETALPFLLGKDSEWLNVLAREAVPPRGVLMTGAVRSEGERETWRVWNSVEVIDSSGKIAATYDKNKLVPFGEFVPFRNILPIEKITHGNVDFSRGAGPQDMTIAGLPIVSPLICYEVIFPKLAVSKNSQAQWMLNVTNDAWFGNSSGPYQHFAMARARAVENGIPLIRVANSGISGLVNAVGRVYKFIPLGVTMVEDVPLPEPLKVFTYYSRVGDLGLFFLMGFVFFVGFCLQKSKKV